MMTTDDRLHHLHAKNLGDSRPICILVGRKEVNGTNHHQMMGIMGGGVRVIGVEVEAEVILWTSTC